MFYRPAKIGFIGCGGYALQLIKRLWTMPRHGVVAAVSCRPSDAEGVAACVARGIPVFESVEEFLDYGRDRLDAIANPTPIHLHEPLTRQCLQAGLPVFLEKPPVASTEEHLALINESRRYGLSVPVCFNSIYSHLVQELKREILAGRYGRVRRIRNMAAWLRSDAYFQRNDWAGKVRLNERWVLDGTLNNPLAHLIANSLYLASPEHHGMDRPLSVEAELYRGNAIESEDTSSTRIITRSKVEIISHLTLCGEEEVDPFTVIECDEATIHFHNYEMMTITYPDGRREARESYRDSRIDMLEELCAGVWTRERPLCDLEMCLPFTLTVNAAFLSSWPVRSLPPTAIHRLSHGRSTRIEIPGINRILTSAHERGILLSEAGVDWAEPARVVSVTDSTSVAEMSEILVPEEKDEVDAPWRAVKAG